MSDPIFGIHGAALELRSKRMGILASNIANAATPGFLASSVDCERLVHLKIAAGGGYDDRQVYESLAPGVVDEVGNNVDLEAETTALVSDNLLFQAMVNGFNYKVGVLRTAMGTR